MLMQPLLDNNDCLLKSAAQQHGFEYIKKWQFDQATHGFLDKNGRAKLAIKGPL